jgi:hypothetical protein
MKNMQGSIQIIQNAQVKQDNGRSEKNALTVKEKPRGEATILNLTDTEIQTYICK